MNKKQMKAHARKTLKNHYRLLILVCIFASLIRVDNSDTINRLTGALSVSKNIAADVVYNGHVGLADIYDYIFNSDNRTNNIKYEKVGPVELGRADGVFAKMINGITSGSSFVALFYFINSIAHSDSIASIIFILLILLAAIFLWFFIAQVYSVITRRVLLEARTYEEVPIQRLTYLIRVRRWMNVGWVIFVTTMLNLLWCLTIVGGIIKYFSYRQVPYILAENPDISARQAIKLSEEMMKGHKLEYIWFSVSFIGWKILGVLTLGLVDIFFTVPYLMAAKSEFFVERRSEAIAKQISGYELLNDKFLYEFASEMDLAIAYHDMEEIMRNPMPEPDSRSGIAKFFADFFGIVHKRSKKELAWCEYEEQQLHIDQTLPVLARRSYPSRLFPLPEKSVATRMEQLDYVRHYSLSSLIIMFFGFSFVGWLWEVSIHLVEDGVFVNRGVLHGPWLPIYGSGAVMILILLNKFRKQPWLEFLLTVIVCGVVEYFTSWYLEIKYDGTKWWDYSGYFININGRICAEGLLVFGIGGIAMVYVCGPLLDNLLQKVKQSILWPICITLVVIFLCDLAFSKQSPNTGAGITDYAWIKNCLYYAVQYVRMRVVLPVALP